MGRYVQVYLYYVLNKLDSIIGITRFKSHSERLELVIAPCHDSAVPRKVQLNYKWHGVSNLAEIWSTKPLSDISSRNTPRARRA